MFSITDFVAKFSSYSDNELLAIMQQPDSYSYEAVEAAKIVTKQKGGMEALTKRLEEEAVVQNEIIRIEKETIEMGKNGIDADFIKTVTKSSLLADDKVKEIIDVRYVEVEKEIENKKITTRTIIGSVVGGAIASIVGGILWGLQIIFSHRIFYILLV